MNSSRQQWRMARILGLAMLVFVVATSALAQAQTGNLFGRVLDADGGALPGVTVTLSDIGATQVFITDSEGRFRFLSLSPGRYTLTAELAGFGSVVRTGVDVNLGRNTNIDLRLTPALEQTITVTAETPLLDVRKTGTGATMTRVDLEEIPTARDPWVILQQVPGVQVDRINVGGNESGQQSNFIGKGSSRSQATWNVDGVAITDMAATGASPTYYDFDAFEEMQATTGGSDPAIQTPGVQLNMVTKRGSNQFDGSGRFLWTDSEFQADATVPEEARGYLQFVNQIDNIQDYGAEFGGPVVRDRLWFWGSYGRNEIDLLVAAGARQASDFTLLENYAGKLNAQILSNNSATGFYHYGDKIKTGRSVGPLRPQETGWNQSGPTPIWKLEDTHIFSPNFYLTGMISDVGGGFQLTPEGGLDTPVWRDHDRIWRGSFLHYETTRPQDQYRLDGSTFFDTAALNHELKFGFGYRDTPVNTIGLWPGGGNVLLFGTVGSLCAPLGADPANCGLAIVGRNVDQNYESNYTDFYVGDTILVGNLTLQVGARYDIQESKNLATTVAGNPVLPELLPQATYPGDQRSLEWTSISPRIGATYALGTTRRTLIRAAYNQYVDQLSAATITAANPFPWISGYLMMFEDRDQNKRLDPGETLDLTTLGFPNQWLAPYYINPEDPTGATGTTTRIDFDMDPPQTTEYIIGVEHELMPEFTLGLNYTHRRMDDFVWTQFEKTRGAGDFYSTADYEQVDTATGQLPDGTSYSVPVFGLREGNDRPLWGVLTNRPDYDQTFDGVELVATKRLSNRWMLRGNVAWNDHRQNVGPGGFPAGDPTRQLSNSTGCTTCDDAQVVQRSAGSGDKGEVWMNAGWSSSISGLYQFPFGINFGASLTMREGYAVPYRHDVVATRTEGTKTIMVSPEPDARRLDDIVNLDLRLAKEFRIADTVGLTISADAFNVTNERPVMQRQGLIATDTGPRAAGNRVNELQSPRVIRFGARINF
ncbi:MAG: carboxypeptidase regulatory-like domain-containing protein [Acidobacteria bacterium]|nr:carboxypeptidase regulatory-like domain-containing protein [Acidobacteriota bacterium]